LREASTAASGSGKRSLDLRRRDFVGLLGGAAAAWQLAARAQQPAMPVIGFLSSRSPGESGDAVAAFRRGLREAGFVEGQNAIIAFRWAEGHYERLSALSTDLISLRAAVIVAAGGTPPVLAVRAANSNIPLVFTAVADPVQLGFVASFNRPGGNITGISLFNNSLSEKRVGLLHELIPAATIVALLINPKSPILEEDFSPVHATARSLGIMVHVLNASTDDELNSVFEALPRLGVRALALQGEPFFDIRRDRIIGLAKRLNMPAIYAWREYVQAGGLMSYGTNLIDNYRHAGVYVGRILKGEKPAELPIVRPTKFEFAINLQTARTLGLEVPPTLLARADEVIE
jgi:putative tryptophan/tyrosine transport system substrate-binding protein